MVNYYEVQVVFQDIQHQLRDNILHHSLRYNSFMKSTLNLYVSWIHSILLCGSLCDIAQPCKLFTSRYLTLFRMDIFGAGHGWRLGQKGSPSLKSLTQILQWWNLAQLYLTWRRSKKYMTWLLLTSAFFSRNQQILLYQEIQVYIAFWYRISNYFKFSWVFKDLFNKPGYNFDDVRSC